MNKSVLLILGILLVGLAFAYVAPDADNVVLTLTKGYTAPSQDNVVLTLQRFPGNYTPPVDTCTYSGSGDWIIACADACVLTTPTIVSGALYITNYTEGEYIKIYTNITAQDFYKDDTCFVYVDDALGTLLIN